jgi:hypothetical protein
MKSTSPVPSIVSVPPVTGVPLALSLKYWFASVLDVPWELALDDDDDEPLPLLDGLLLLEQAAATRAAVAVRQTNHRTDRKRVID